MIIKIYRLENWLYNHHLKVFALIIKMIIRVMFSAVIPPSVSIGEGTFITYHGLGVVIHKNVVIGKNCCIRQMLQLLVAGGGIPTRGDNVEINAGAVIVGPVHIGNYVRIGANAVVIQDIPDNCTVVGVPAKVVRVYKPGENTFSI